MKTNENGQENTFPFPFLFLCGNEIRLGEGRIKNEIGSDKLGLKRDRDIWTYRNS